MEEEIDNEYNFDADDEDSLDNEEVSSLMENHDLDFEEAKEVSELMNSEGLDEEEAIEVGELTSGSSWGVIPTIIVVGLILWAISSLFSGGGKSDNTDIFRTQNNSYDTVQKTITRDDAISEHWDEIKDDLNGTETVNACSEDSGNCYDLDADISNGEIDTVHFINGGYLEIGAGIDESGDASGFDQEGKGWDFTLDMDSSIVDDAITDWANNNSYTVE